MSDTPFSDSTSSTADVVTAVDFTGTTLTLTKQAGDDLTTTISSSPQVVTGLTYNAENDDKLKLTQSAGQGSFEVTIPSPDDPVHIRLSLGSNSSGTAQNPWKFLNEIIKTSGIAYSTTTGKITIQTAGTYLLTLNVQYRGNLLDDQEANFGVYQEFASGGSDLLTLNLNQQYDQIGTVTRMNNSATTIVTAVVGDSFYCRFFEDVVSFVNTTQGTNWNMSRLSS